MSFWAGRRIWITGGTGFLGKVLTRQLCERGCGQVFSTGRKDGDLTNPAAIRELLSTTRPNIIIHLAAVVGGIGANREHPADCLYQNLMMGAQLMHEGWKGGVEKFVALGTVCSYPKFTPLPFREEDLWGGATRGRPAPPTRLRRRCCLCMDRPRTRFVCLARMYFQKWPAPGGPFITSESVFGSDQLPSRPRG